MAEWDYSALPEVYEGGEHVWVNNGDGTFSRYLLAENRGQSGLGEAVEPAGFLWLDDGRKVPVTADGEWLAEPQDMELPPGDWIQTTGDYRGESYMVPTNDDESVYMQIGRDKDPTYHKKQPDGEWVQTSEKEYQEAVDSSGTGDPTRASQYGRVAQDRVEKLDDLKADGDDTLGALSAATNMMAANESETCKAAVSKLGRVTDSAQRTSDGLKSLSTAQGEFTTAVNDYNAKRKDLDNQKRLAENAQRQAKAALDGANQRGQKVDYSVDGMTMYINGESMPSAQYSAKELQTINAQLKSAKDAFAQAQVPIRAKINAVQDLGVR